MLLQQRTHVLLDLGALGAVRHTRKAANNATNAFQRLVDDLEPVGFTLLLRL